MHGYPDIAVSLTQESIGQAIELRSRYLIIELRLDQLQWSAEELSRFLSESSQHHHPQSRKPYQTILTDRDSPQHKDTYLLDKVDWSLVDYLDIDINDFPQRAQAWIAAARAQGVQIIRSHHDYGQWVDPAVYVAEHHLAFDEADIIKIASHCHTREQALATLAAYDSIQRPAVLLGMGEAGQITRTQAVEHGAPMSYAYPAHGHSAAPGQLSAESLHLAHRMGQSAHQIHGVIGHPVLHSKGPIIFGKYFSDTGLDHEYIRLAMSSVAELDQWYFLPRGCFNVTAPYKYDASAFAGHGADTPSNILTLSHGHWSRALSDPMGIHRAIIERITLAGRHALVIGSGGAADSGCRALAEGNCQSLTVCARNEDTRKALASKYEAQHRAWTDVQMCVDKADLILWTVPGSAWPTELEVHSPNTVLLDANYADRIPEHIQSSLKYIPGESWLYHQATVLMDLIAEHDELSSADYIDLLTQPLDSPSSIALIGLPASGKTTTARLLAAHLGWDVIDMDTEIECRSGKTIAAIWQEQGEDAFREMETALLEEVADRKRIVISTGGGAVTRSSNRTALQGHSCVWLALDPVQAAQRVQGSDRPLLAGADRVDQMIHLHHQRYRHYASCCDLAIHAGVHSPEQIAHRLYAEYSKLL